MAPFFTIAQDFSISYNFPENIDINNEYTINVEINKSDIENFATYKQFLAKGITVKNLTNNSADFDFSENTICYTWKRTPIDSIIKISYKIIVDSTFNKDFETYGQFSYIIDNKRGVIKTKETKVSIMEKASENQHGKTQTDIEENNDTTVSIKKEYNCDVKVKRNLTVVNNMEITVDLQIEKCNYSGMAIIQENIPENCTIEYIDSKNTESDFQANIFEVKIFQMSDNQEKYEIIYTIKSETEFNDFPSISGEYKYVNKSKLEKISITNGTKNGNFSVNNSIPENENKNDSIQSDKGENAILKYFNE